MKKSWFIHVGSIVLFLLLTVVYFSPKLEGKQLQQGDIEKWEGMAHEAAEYEKEGGSSAWCGSMFSGMPAYTISIRHNYPNAMSWLEKPIYVLGNGDGAILFLSMLCMYILLSVMGSPTFVSILGAIAYAFASYVLIIIGAGHVTKGLVMAYMPLVLSGIYLTIKKKWLWGGLLFTIAVYFTLRNNHLQIVYYLMLLCLFFYAAFLFYNLKEKLYSDVLKVTGVFAIGVVFAVLANSALLYSNYEMGKTSVRGKSELTSNVDGKTDKSSGLDRDYAFAWSYGKAETLTMLIPDLYGGASGGVLSDDSNLAKAFNEKGYQKPKVLHSYTYWGDQPFTSGPVYFGAIVCFLFVLSLFVVKSKVKWWIVGASALLIMMSWGKNFASLNDLLFHYLPFYNKFRTPSMALVIPQLTFVLLSCMALTTIYKKEIEYVKLKKYLFISAGITGGLCLLFAVMPSLFMSFTSPMDANYQLPDWYMSALILDREDLLTSDAWRSFFFILIAFLILYVCTMPKKENLLKYGLAAIAFLTLCDLWTVDRRYLNDDSFVNDHKKKNSYVESPADKMILEDKDLSYRVLTLNNPFNDTDVPYFHKSIGGYNAAKLRRYQDLIDIHIDPEMKMLMTNLRSVKTLAEADSLVTKTSTPVLDMLNMRYLIINKDIPAATNKSANGNAWFVKNVQYVNDADAEMTALNKVNPKTTAVVDKSFSSVVKEGPVDVDSSASITMTEYKPNKVTYKSNSNKDAVAVFSEVYYENGWKAFIDGKPVDHFKTDWILRGLNVPAGNHTIEFSFEPDTYWNLMKLTSVLSFLLLASLILLVVRGIVKGKKDEVCNMVSEKK
ncbi:MAG: YfhO family protein [Paludibacteraceae bacterium]|nr:YfhO family protein [Paludibacteraceae bacterium]